MLKTRDLPTRYLWAAEARGARRGAVSSVADQGVGKGGKGVDAVESIARVAPNDGGVKPVSPVGHELLDAAVGALVRCACGRSTRWARPKRKHRCLTAGGERAPVVSIRKRATWDLRLLVDGVVVVALVRSDGADAGGLVPGRVTERGQLI